MHVSTNLNIWLQIAAFISHPIWQPNNVRKLFAPCLNYHLYSPTELGLCEKLEVLRVHRTNIAGTMPQEICMLRDKKLNNEDNTGVLYSDCRPNNRTKDPFLKCDCCSDCCDHTTGVYIVDDWKQGAKITTYIKFDKRIKMNYQQNSLTDIMWKLNLVGCNAYCTKRFVQFQTSFFSGVFMMCS